MTIQSTADYDARLIEATVQNIATNYTLEDIEVTEVIEARAAKQHLVATVQGYTQGKYIEFTTQYNADHDLMIPVHSDTPVEPPVREGSPLDKLTHTTAE